MIAYIGNMFGLLPPSTKNDPPFEYRVEKRKEPHNLWDKPDPIKFREIIVRELLSHCIKPSVVFFTLENKKHEVEKSASLQIVFRETQSWRKVEEMLNTVVFPIISTDRTDPVTLFFYSWKNRISNLRELKNHCDDTMKQAKNLVTSNNPSSLQTLDLPAANNATLKRRLNNRLNEIKEAIREILEEGFAELTQNLRTPQLLKSQPVQQTMFFLDRNWQHLRVFSDWTEASMDEEQLLVKVISDDRNYPTNSSTKAVFPVEEIREEKYVDRLKSKFITSKGIIKVEGARRRATFGPPTPAPTRRTSSVILRTPSYDHDFLDEQSTLGYTTSKKDFLNEVVEDSISKVNRILSNGLHSLSLDDFK